MTTYQDNGGVMPGHTHFIQSCEHGHVALRCTCPGVDPATVRTPIVACPPKCPHHKAPHARADWIDDLRGGT